MRHRYFVGLMSAVTIMILLTSLSEQVSGKTITQFTFADLLASEEHEHASAPSRVHEFNEIEQLLNLNGASAAASFADSNERQIGEELPYDQMKQRLQQQHTLFTATAMKQSSSLTGGTNMDTSTKKVDSSTPLDGNVSNPAPVIEDASDEQLAKMEAIQSQNIPISSGGGEDQTPMETKTMDQVVGTPSKIESSQPTKLEVEEPEPEPEPVPTVVNKEEKMTDGCDDTVDDGIMNCELGKNPIRMDSVNAKAIEQAVEKRPFYEIALFYGIVLSILILIVLLISKFRESSSKYLEKFYVKSLRIIIVDVIALMTLNALVQILYYNRILDVVQLEYFNIYGFTIMFSFFGMAWILIAVGYAFILQSFSNAYAKYEVNWPRRREFLIADNEDDVVDDDGEGEESEKAYEERVRNIQYFLIKEDFVIPISHIAYTEPMVLREDFNFAEYLGRVQAKCHLQLFNISLTTLILLMVFFLLVCVIDLIENWLIECLLMLALPLLSFGVAWIENRRQFVIVMQLMNLIASSFEIEVQKFLNLDLKKAVQFRNKLRYPSYVTEPHTYEEVGVSRQMALFPFNAVQFPLKLVHFTLVLQIVWVMMFLLNYSTQMSETWECPIIFVFGLCLILFQLFFVIPFFLKKYAITTNIQQLKDANVIAKVVANQKEKVTLAFARFYRLLKHLRRNSSLTRKNQLRLRPEILDQLREIDSMNLTTIDALAKKLGYKNLSNDELYYLDKAFSEIASKSEGQAAKQRAQTDAVLNSLPSHGTIGGGEKQQEESNSQSGIVPQISPNNRHASKKYSGFNPESLAQIVSTSNNHNGAASDRQNDHINEKQSNGNRLRTQPSHDDQQQILLDLPPPLLVNRQSQIGHSVDLNAKNNNNNNNGAAGFGAESGISSNEKIENNQLNGNGSQEFIAGVGGVGVEKQQPENLFVLSSLTKICSVFTEEVTLDPYRTSFDALMGLFDEKEVVTYAEFSRMVMSLYKKIEQEQLNLILHIDDIRMIEREVFYLEDKFEQISLIRISSFIRNAIEMLPR